jgi:hypothetical protein
VKWWRAARKGGIKVPDGTPGLIPGSKGYGARSRSGQLTGWLSAPPPESGLGFAGGCWSCLAPNRFRRREGGPAGLVTGLATPLSRRGRAWLLLDQGRG